ncbi:MAG: hypothetical protein EPO35_13065 [Acidobacteria bacterium]|nr:MAG: hypothetical protein EPO35_13065 [Acidobacteriota bacterium]
MRLLLTCVLALAPQTPSDPLGAISGVAVDGSTGRVLPGALIYLVGERGGTRAVQVRQVTDPKGRFVFANLPQADQFTLTGSKSGFLDGFNAPETAAAGTSTPIRLSAGEWFPTARVALYPPGAIGGRVLDESGAPVVGADVRLLARVKVQGRAELAAGPVTRTDDRGAFRFAGLPPGGYVAMVPSVQTSVPSSITSEKNRSGSEIAALELNGARLLVDRFLTPPPPAGGRMLVYPATFYPGTTSAAEAGAIVLGYAESRNDVEIHLAPVPTYRVSGIVSGPKEALLNLTLRLLPAGLENLGFGSETATALVDADGRFAFPGVPEGTYLLDGPRSATELAMAGQSAIDVPRLPGPPGYGGFSSNSESVPALPGIDIATRTYRSSNAPNVWAHTPLSVTSDMENVLVALRSMGALGGSVRFELDASQKTPRPAFYVIGLDPASGSPGLGLPRAGVNQDAGDQFLIEGLAPAPYFVRYSGAAGWLVKSISWNGRDYTASPFDALSASSISGVQIVMTNAVPTLSGIVTATDGGLRPGATVLVFPADRTRWFNFGLKPVQFATLVAGTNGSYQTTALPAGDYWVLSIAGPPDDWMRPEYLEIAARSATRVTLAWGQSATADLKMTEIRR